MAFYNLEKKFFGPDGSLYYPEQNPQEFPDDWELPLGTKEVKMEPKMVPVETEE